jgi:hypothetical protein
LVPWRDRFFRGPTRRAFSSERPPVLFLGGESDSMVAPIRLRRRKRRATAMAETGWRRQASFEVRPCWCGLPAPVLRVYEAVVSVRRAGCRGFAGEIVNQIENDGTQREQRLLGGTCR